jgi:hypothetical protein
MIRLIPCTTHKPYYYYYYFNNPIKCIYYQKNKTLPIIKYLSTTSPPPAITTNQQQQQLTKTNLLSSSQIIYYPYEPILDFPSTTTSSSSTTPTTQTITSTIEKTRLRFHRWRMDVTARVEMYRSITNAQDRAANSRALQCKQIFQTVLRDLSEGRFGQLSDLTTKTFQMILQDKRLQGSRKNQIKFSCEILGDAKLLQLVQFGAQTSPTTKASFAQVTYQFNVTTNLRTLFPATIDRSRWHLTMDSKTGKFYYYRDMKSKWRVELNDNFAKGNCPFDFFGSSLPAATTTIINPDGSYPIYAVFERPLHRNDIPWKLHTFG